MQDLCLHVFKYTSSPEISEKSSDLIDVNAGTPTHFRKARPNHIFRSSCFGSGRGRIVLFITSE